MTVALEVIGEPGLKQVLGACAAAPAAPGGVVGDEMKMERSWNSAIGHYLTAAPSHWSFHLFLALGSEWQRHERSRASDRRHRPGSRVGRHGTPSPSDRDAPSADVKTRSGSPGSRPCDLPRATGDGIALERGACGGERAGTTGQIRAVRAARAARTICVDAFHMSAIRRA